jgi:NADH-quinone oxidoreductase subunit M
MPRLTSFFFLFTMASIGVPGTSGFPAELLLIVGALTAHPGLGVAALLGAILGAAYMLSFVRRAFFGPIVHVNVQQVQDLRSREFGLLCVPALLVLFFGFFPDLLMDINRLAAQSWLNRLTG